jgi:hypothetical protein
MANSNSLKLKCVEVISKIGSQNLISEAQRLNEYLSIGNTLTKMDCINILLDTGNSPASVESLIKKAEEIYAYVVSEN